MADISESLFSGQFGGLIVMIMVSAAVVFFLRLLYGPGGLFRNSIWEDARARKRKEEMEKKTSA